MIVVYFPHIRGEGNFSPIYVCPPEGNDSLSNKAGLLYYWVDYTLAFKSVDKDLQRKPRVLKPSLNLYLHIKLMYILWSKLYGV